MEAAVRIAVAVAAVFRSVGVVGVVGDDAAGMAADD